MRNSYLNPLAAVVLSTACVMVSGLPVQASEQDSRIVSSARNSYNFKTYLKGDNISVESAAGIVTLKGTVAQDFHKTLAQDTVYGLPGVKGVNNQLSVVGEQLPEHSDGWITTKVKTVLTFHKNVSASDTEINTRNGVVTLTGKAESEAQKQLTGEYAKDVDGVKEVRNDLAVITPAKPASQTMGEKIDDTSLTAQVKMTLLFHKSTRAISTKVVTRDGVVTLRGEAKNRAERDLASKLALDIKGVKQIKNKMTVRKS